MQTIEADDAQTPPDVRPSFERFRLQWALATGLVVAAATGVFSWQVSSVASSSNSFGSRWTTEAPVIPIGGQQILEELAAVRHRPQGAWAIEPTDVAGDGGHRLPSDKAQPSSVSAGAETSPARPRRRKAKRAAAPAAAQKAPLDAYAAQFGAPEQYRAGNALHVGATLKDPSTSSSLEGVMLAARLQTEVASVPSGGPVIALLQRPANVGGTLWPRGTEVHGTCGGSGNSDTRVFVTFEALRLPSGRTQKLRGVGVDLQGRHGIPGRKILTRRSAGSVGLAAAASAARTLGRSLAGSAGAILGAGIEGAASSGESKVQRLDQDEYVVLVARGTPLQIYLTSGKVSERETD